MHPGLVPIEHRRLAGETDEDEAARRFPEDVARYGVAYGVSMLAFERRAHEAQRIGLVSDHDSDVGEGPGSRS